MHVRPAPTPQRAQSLQPYQYQMNIYRHLSLPLSHYPPNHLTPLPSTSTAQGRVLDESPRLSGTPQPRIPEPPNKLFPLEMRKFYIGASSCARLLHLPPPIFFAALSNLSCCAHFFLFATFFNQGTIITCSRRMCAYNNRAKQS